jgi:hypothetical protein
MGRAVELSLSESGGVVLFADGVLDRIGRVARFRRWVLAVTNLNPLSYPGHSTPYLMQFWQVGFSSSHCLAVSNQANRNDVHGRHSRGG